MKKQLAPYYVSRAAISALFGYVLSLDGEAWMGILIGLLMFAGFVWYALSGRYLIDTNSPLTPLKRDARGKEIRNRALAAAVAAGGVIYGGSALLSMFYPLPANMGTWALIAGTAVYFVISNWMYSRDIK